MILREGAKELKLRFSLVTLLFLVLILIRSYANVLFLFHYSHRSCKERGLKNKAYIEQNRNEATPSRGCFVVYKEQRALRLLDFDDGDACAAETDVFVPVVGYAADGVEVLADDGAQGASAGAVEDAHAVLLEENGIVDEVVDGREGFFCTHAAHIEFGTEVELLLVDGVACLLADEGRYLRGGDFLGGAVGDFESVEGHGGGHDAEENTRGFALEALHHADGGLPLDADVVTDLGFDGFGGSDGCALVGGEGAEEVAEGGTGGGSVLLALLSATDLIHLAGDGVVLCAVGFFLHLVAEILEFLTCGAGALAVGLALLDGADGVFDGSVGSLEQALGFLTGVGEDFAFALREGGEFLLVVRDGLLEFLLAIVDVATFVFPIHFVADNVLEIFVAHHIVFAHEVGGVANDIVGNADLAGDFNGEGATGVADLEHEERLHLGAVVEHGTVDHIATRLGEVFEILIVGGDDAAGVAVDKLTEDGFGEGTTNLRFGAATEFVDEEKAARGAVFHHRLHVE